MTAEELLLGYDWTYRWLFSHASIWRRRPSDLSAWPAYLASAYLYKRSNRLWHFLIKRRLVHAVWRPMVELTRLRHVRFRHRLAQSAADPAAPRHRSRRNLKVAEPSRLCSPEDLRPSERRNFVPAGV